MLEGNVKPTWLHTHRDELRVSGREFDVVRNILYLPEDVLQPGTTTLSVGEGFSNFAHVLHKKFGVNAFAVDPIYSILKPQDAVGGRDGNRDDKYTAIWYRFLGGAYKENPMDYLPDPNRVVAGSVYQLPFRSETFDLVTQSVVFQHTIFDNALPELLRVTKQGGEIRIGETICELDRVENQGLFSLRAPADKEISGGFDLLLSQSDLTTYGVIDYDNIRHSDVLHAVIIHKETHSDEPSLYYDAQAYQRNHQRPPVLTHLSHKDKYGYVFQSFFNSRSWGQ